MPSFQLVRCKDVVVDAGLDVPSWNDLSLPRPVEEPELEPNQPKFGWQQQASRQMEKKFVSDHLWPRFDNGQRASMRSQCGPLASASLTALPTSRATRIDPQPFRLAGYTCPSPCLTAPAEVAANSTSWATIAHRVLKRGVREERFSS